MPGTGQPLDNLLNISLNGFTLSLWTFVKALFLIGLLLYLAFALIVIRQVGLMTNTLNTNFEAPVKLIAWIHLLVALGVFLLALITL